MDIGAVHIGGVDMAWMALLLLSVLVGLLKGLVSQVLSLMGWGVSYVGAQWLAADVAPFIPVGSPGSGLNMTAGLVVAFVALFMAWATTSWFIRQLVRSSALSATDRALGGLFGAARAVIIGLAVVTLVGMTPLAASQGWQASRGSAWLQALATGLRPVLPPEVTRYLPGT